MLPIPPPPMPPKKGLVGKQKSDPKKLRMGGGKIWEDSSLDDWDPSKYPSCALKNPSCTIAVYVEKNVTSN